MKISALLTIPKKLSKLLTKKQKIFLVILFFLTISLSFIETLGISAIMPFITVASNPDVLNDGYYKTAYDLFGFTEKNSFVIIFGVVIIIFYAFRSLFNIFYTYSINKYSFVVHKNLSLNLFKVFFNIPYRNFVQKNSGEIIHIIGNETNRVTGLLVNLLQIFSELFTVLMLYSILIIVNWQMSLILTAILLLVVYLVINILLRISTRQGQKVTESNLKISRIVHEAFYNFKFVKLKGTESDYFERYNKNVKISARARLISNTLGGLPRNFLESFGFSLLIAVVIFISWRTGSPESIIPIISMYALALYRILPAITRTLSYLNEVAYNYYALDTVYDAVNQETENEKDEQLSFKESIKIDSLYFKYNTGNDVLKNTCLEIKKGDSIAITGESGSGKSTLADILIGIHKPLSGNLYIDDVKITNDNIRSWRKKIGYIPQNIYLFDGTVAENVVFSDKYDKEQLIKSLKMARIWDFLEKNNGIDTMVGEGGIQLSGGQKQRVGIARALYSNPDVLVLDEATSSLDNDTESKIMNEIYELSEGKTLIIIAHRLSTVEQCKRRVEVINGGIKE
ncbi:MAG: ABC transporter ATP-binding protein [Treponema sp.]|nr:ABC transporter ATP-binding protein [Treponema sp.]